jgi:glycosyltransferase involved in cell wall biosynthesis
MKITILSEYFFPDEASTGKLLSDLFKTIGEKNANLEVQVITSDRLYRGGLKKLSRNEMWSGIGITRLTGPRLNRSSPILRIFADVLFCFQAFVHLILLPKPDAIVVVTNPFLLPFVARLFFVLFRVPYYYVIHDVFPDIAVATGLISERGFFASVFRYFQKGWLHSAKMVIVLGRCMRDTVCHRYALSSSKVVVLTTWADPRKILPLEDDGFLRTNHHLEGPIVLYAGNLGNFQDFDTILNAAGLLLGRKTSINFLFVGYGAKREYIETVVRDRSLRNVKVLDPVDENHLNQLLCSADISLVTLEKGADGLGVPSKLYTIMASGRPIIGIVMQNSEVALTIDECDCGVRVEPGDSEELANTIFSLCMAPDRLKEMGYNARARFENQFTLEFVSERYRDVLGI